MENFIMLIIGGVINGILFYIVKGYFTGAKEEIKRVEESLSQRVLSNDKKIDKILNANNAIHSEILIKFSNWEDRIKVILDQIVLKQFNKDPSDLKEYVIKTFSELDEIIKKDMNDVKKDMEVLHYHIKETVIVVNDMKINDKDKETIRQLMSMVEKIELERSQEIVNVELKLNKVFTICKIMTNDYKDLEKRFKAVEVSSRTKIRLT